MRALDSSILIVDDDRDTADSFSRLLLALGFQALIAYSGGEALALAQSHLPHLVLLDLNLPDINGFEIAESLRRTSLDRPLTIVAISSWICEDEREQLHAAGFDGYLLKPVAIEELRRILVDRDRWGRLQPPGRANFHND